MFYQTLIVLGAPCKGHSAIGGSFKLCNLILLRPHTSGNALHVCQGNGWTTSRTNRLGSNYRLSRSLGSLSGFRGLSDCRSGWSTCRENDSKDSAQYDQ